MTSNLATTGFAVNRNIAVSAHADEKVTIAGHTFPLSPSRAIPSEAVEHLRDTIRTFVVPALGTVKGRIIESLARLIPYLGRMQRRITHSMLINGYYSDKHRAWIVHPVPVSERTLRRHLNDLEDMGVIGRTRNRNGQAFTYHFNYALLVARRSVATIYSTISRLAKHFGTAISSTRARRIAENLVKSGDTPDEIEASICRLFEPKTPVILSPHKVCDISSLDKSSEEEAGEESGMKEIRLKQTRTQRAQPAPTQEQEGVNCSATGQSWQDRVKRRRASVTADEENRELIEEGRRIAAERAARHHPADPLAAPAQALRAVVRQAGQYLQDRAKARQRTAKATPEHLQRVWAEAVSAATGAPAAGWTVKEVSQIRHIVKRVPLTDPTATWSSILSWVATNWGEANALARPAAFKHADNVDKIIKAQPRIYHFLRYAEEYAQAYLTLFHGEGVDAKQEQAMDRLQAEFDRYCGKAREVAQVGADDLPPEFLTDADLARTAEQAAARGEDERAAAALKRREGYRKARAEYYGRRQVNETQAKEFDKAVRVHRVREERIEIEADPEIQAQFPTVDRSEMYEDD